MNENIKTIIGWWKLEGQRQTNPFLKFFIFYMCFDAWLTSESGMDADKGKIEWFIQNDNFFKNVWKEIQFKKIDSWLRGLQKFSPIKDLRPGHQNKEVHLNDIKNIEEIIRFIYQIRCNLFHGSINLMDREYQSLISDSSKILEEWIIWVYDKS